MSNMNHIDVEKLIEAKFAQTPLPLKSWFDTTKLKQLAKQSLTDDIERLDSEDLAQNYYDYMKSKGGLESIEDYNKLKTKLIELPELGQAISGIRFRGMDINKPFINIAITSNRITATGIDQSISFLKREYSEFKPKCIRVFIPNNGDLKTKANWNTITEQIKAFGRTPKWDKVLIGNQLHALIDDSDKTFKINRTIDLVEGFEIKLVNFDEQDKYYSEYKQGYKKLFKRHAEFLNFTSCADYEDLAEISRTEGYNFVLTKSDEFVGLFSLDYNGPQHCGVEGLYITEKFILPSYHKKGIGKMFEKSVFNTLVDLDLVDKDTVVFGEIDYDNKGSLHSAYNNGREEIGRHLWVS